MLFYQHNLVTHSIGLIFYHNGIHYTKKKLDSELQDKEKINAVVPCRDMLKKALKLDQVHIFGDISMSQLLEKIDFVIERTNINQLNREQKLKPQMLITIISLAEFGWLFETDKNQQDYYHDRILKQQKSLKNDSALLYNNIS